MIHPSYKELIDIINKGQDNDDAPVISSRYSLVLAASKRARQLIAGAEPTVKVKKGMKPLSIAVEEMYEGEVTILPEETTEDETSEDIE
ncbi:MAG TPA: DNA-directed RNA polymerase subunit omega [Candidatus Fusicatenibacter merdavium]|uniref:DNA-directed RNA polymerase subunit omega n=1 Tax=Candidatus Fusicatenibacter merdavium TaxID=2838600 RepID=A0A9D1XDS5_9FIRM|nr:DNA-directed RNA polymerase subunit omega [Candidatus Fusicatenibacter merdavium]